MAKNYKVKVMSDPSPFCARIILADEWLGMDPEETKRCLRAVASEWPKDVKTKYAITCGGFLRIEWPHDEIDERFDQDAGIEKLTPILTEYAEEKLWEVLTPGIVKLLSNQTHYLSIGIDIFTAVYNFKDNHTELVAMVDLERKKAFITGKTYPTPYQSAWLVPMELDSHFTKLGRASACILGCHDLNMFSHRSHANLKKSTTNKVSEKAKILKNFSNAMKRNQPEIVLQHPHTTDTERIWNTAISGMESDYPFVKKFASAGRYYNTKGEPRSTLKKVLASTKRGDTLDFVVHPPK